MLQAGLLAAGVAAATQESQYGALAVGALGIGATAWQARYGRSHELEADRYGVEYMVRAGYDPQDRKSTRLNSSHVAISYAVFCLKKTKPTIVHPLES